MIELFKKYTHFLLSNFRFYRKRKGGVWYKVKDFEVSGFAAASEYWTQENPNVSDLNEIASEDYR